MSGVLVATCMQPTIPVFTAMIGVTLGLEPGSCQKFMGILLAVGGSVCMVRVLADMLYKRHIRLYAAFVANRPHICYQSNIASLLLQGSCITELGMHLSCFTSP